MKVEQMKDKDDYKMTIKNLKVRYANYEFDF